MAAAANIQDYFNCVMCYEVFQDPTTLHCHHTFCRRCLQRFVQTKEDTVQLRGIPCPVCRQTTPITDPGQPVEDWVNQLRSNFYIAGLMEALDTKEKDCHMCTLEGQSTKATVWCINCDSPFCESCQKFHSRAPSSKSHEVIEISSISWESLQTRRLRFCDIHTDKLLEFFCKDCDLLACNSCCTIKHRKCDNVTTVAEAGKSRRSELKSQQDNLRTELERAKEKMENKKRIKAKLCEQMESTEMAIKKDTDMVIAEMRKKEIVLIQEANETFETEIQNIEEDIKNIDKITKVTDQNIQLVTHLMNCGSDSDLLTQHKGNRTAKCSMENVGDLSEEHADIEFVSNVTDVIDKLTPLNLGEIVVRQQEVPERWVDTRIRVDRNNQRQTYMTAFNTRTHKDKQDPNLTDLTVLMVNDIRTIVVTDWNNKCLKCFYVKNSKTSHSRLSVGGRPWSVIRFSQDQVAVSVPDECQICVISVTPQLKRHSTIATVKTYYGLAAINNRTLAVSSCWTDPVTVDLIDVTGKVLRSITTGMLGQRLFSHPSYLFVTPKSDIIVSDSGEEAVICITQTGEIKFKWCPGEGQLNFPRGIDYDRSDCIFVADINLHKITKLTGDGQFVQDVLTSRDGLNCPHSVFFHDNCVYVVHNSGEIRAYRLT